MKKIINLLLNGQLTALLQQMRKLNNGTKGVYNLQPLPAYREMTPAKRVNQLHMKNY